MKWIKQILKVEPYLITCLWNDNDIRVIDMTDFIKNNSVNINNSYHQLKDKERFTQVKCDGTTLYWENGLMLKDIDGIEKLGPLDIDPDYLYELSVSSKNKFSKERSG